MSAVWTVVTVCLLAALTPVARAVQVTECSLPASGVFVSISPELEIVEDQKLRPLAVSWFGINAQKGDYLELVHSETGAVFINLTMYELEPDGWVESNATWDGSLIPNNLEGPAEPCFPYQAKYIRDGNALYSSCLILRPYWMREQRTDLSGTRLSKVVIPGTHDAGATSYFSSTAAENLVGRWTFTQDESLWQVLLFGARYLDMRISYYNNTQDKFYVNHGEIIIAPLRRYVDDVVKFMYQTDEIVIFDIHELVHGFSDQPERHEELIAFLESSFGSHMAPRSLGPDPTLGELWSINRRLIVTYPSNELYDSQYLWHTVHHLWGNVNTIEDLEAFLYTGISEQVNRGSLWSSMAQFTPSPMDVVLNKWGGLRGAAMQTNFPVTNWFRQDWWDEVNIIAMDFLPFSDVIFVAVEANKLRALCHENRRSVT
ncbi:PI-PLC X domain-containing protein 3 [Chionoecetes opilio]|uniref:PI-PLC X domain-containing protein 3 n=1 Tax=Chionoecetes opilio TaxID=41210 RepID=A0A8J4Y4W6_CHIOP|nr:PI-PLC X domain-containing protein 3 [Chionoecetes opilio]